MSAPIVETLVVPGYEGRALRVAAGRRVRVTDVEGCQVGDLFAHVAADPAELVCPAATRIATQRLFPQVGQSFYSNRHRPLLDFVADDSPGKHDMVYATCNPAFFEAMGESREHPSCYANYLAAARAIGLDVIDVPDPVNLFQHTPPDPESGALLGYPTPSNAGDSVTFETRDDLIVVLTACSSDLVFDGVDFIGGKSTPLRIDVFES
jgi:uncharacterized protein YcgI (DUF1989 family)